MSIRYPSYGKKKSFSDIKNTSRARGICINAIDRIMTILTYVKGCRIPHLAV